MPTRSLYPLYGFLSICIAIALCILGATIFANRIDEHQRRELLKQVQYASLLITPEEVATLSATESDLSNPVYIKIKEQFTRFRSFNPDIRFVYLMGYSPEIKTQFFYVDSEPETSNDYSPPGQLFPDTRPEDIAYYLTGEPYTDGPYRDSWGEWVSGHVPVRDANGNVVALVGIDIATHVWYQQITFVRIMFGIVALLLSLLIYFLTTRFTKKERSLRQLTTQNMKLQQHEVKLGEIQSLAQLGKVTIYLEKKTIVLDEQFKALYGSLGSHLSFEHFMSLVHPDDIPTVEHALLEMEGVDINYSWFDIRIGTHDTGFRKYHFYGTIERNTSGSSEKFSGIMQDITDLK